MRQKTELIASGIDFLGLVSFAGGNSDHLHAKICKHHHLQSHQHAKPAVGEKPAMFPEIADACSDTVIAQAEHNHAGAGHNHHHNRDHFNHGKPEFEFAVGFDSCQIDGAHRYERHQCPDPLRHRWKPDAHIDTDRGDFRDTGDHPHEPVVPTGQITRQGTKMVLRIAAKGARNRLMYGHFAESAHNDEDRDSAQYIGEQDRRPGELDRAGGTEE